MSRALRGTARAFAAARTLIESGTGVQCIQMLPAATRAVFQEHAQQGERQYAGRALALGTAAAAVLGASTLDVHAKQPEQELPPPPKVSGLVPLQEKQKLFFLYEKRIRELSNAEKVFEYFANEKRDDGTTYMRPQDLLASLVAVYPPDDDTVVRSGSLPGEPKAGLPTSTANKLSNFFLKHFDIDDDGFISFHEYLLIITLLSIPLKDAETAFAMLDEDDSGTIDKDEFLALTSLLKERSRQTAGAGAGRTGLKQDGSVDDSGLMQHFFGPDGTKKLDLATFNKFLEGLHGEIDRLEFEHYDPRHTGYMSGRDFAHSMVASVSLHSIHKYLKRVDDLPESLRRAKISHDDFNTFAALWRNVHSLAVATDLHYNAKGYFRKEDFKRAAKKITGHALSDAQVDIVYEIFDSEGGEADGSLAVHEFVGIIRQREGRHKKASVGIPELQDMGFFDCLRSCCGL